MPSTPNPHPSLRYHRGDPQLQGLQNIVNDIENTVLVFKDGIAFDSPALLDSTRGRYGQY